MQLNLDSLTFYGPYALQALVPFRVLMAMGVGALVYWLAPQAWRKTALVVISLVIVLMGYERPVMLVVGIVLVCAAVFWAVQHSVPRKFILIGIVALYGLAHFAFGLITFTPWLNFTGLTAAYVLPTIGLTSAFTFLRLIHFTVDFGKAWSPGKERTSPHPGPFIAWCLFFPTFVHLPLIRYQAFAQQFENLPQRLSPTQLTTGMQRVGQGILKGVCIALVYVTLNPTQTLLTPQGRAFGELFLAAIISAVTYYIGFSAYMDIGIGAATLFGITLPENFAPVLKMLRINRMRDFWRNWNITTTQWLNDYVFTPLGGHRKHPVRNVLLTMTVCGLWHSISMFGAAWGFGLGLLLLIEHAWNRMRIRRNWPEVPSPVRTALLMCGAAFVNLALTPYGYTAESAKYLYPLYWWGVAGSR
jgi:D-alanyl-lipoteichoic acid acyltransferase DltB (MBOAT superfamily)